MDGGAWWATYSPRGRKESDLLSDFTSLYFSRYCTVRLKMFYFWSLFLMYFLCEKYYKPIYSIVLYSQLC